MLIYPVVRYYFCHESYILIVRLFFKPAPQTVARSTAEATLIALNNSWAKIAFHLLRAQIIEKLFAVLRNSPWFSKGPYEKLPAALIRTLLIYFISNACFTHTSTCTRLALEPVEMESVQK